MRSNPLQSSGNAGELSEKMLARTDFSKHKSGLRLLENFVVLSEGGLMRRSGTRYVTELKDSSVKGRLVPFIFSTVQAYMLELGEQIIRFYRHQGQIAAADITGSISNGTFDSDLTDWTDKDTGGTATSVWTSAYMKLTGDGTESAWRQQTVTSITSGAKYSLKFRIIGSPGDEVLLRIGTTDGGTETVNDRAFKVGYHIWTFTAGATTIYLGFRHSVAKALGVDDVSFIDNTAIELQTPFTAAQIFAVSGPQSADVLYMFHVSHPTYRLERYAHDSWSLVEVAWQDGPWGPENSTSTTITAASATGLAITFTASATAGINGDAGFKSTDVGRLIRLSDNSTVNWGWGIIVEVTSTTAVKVDIKRTVTVTTAEEKWMLGEWSETTGYPSIGAFYEQRLFAANSTDKPQTLWASQTADFENHAPDSDPTEDTWDATVEDDDALDYTISGDDVSAIYWMSPGEDTLAVGTKSAEWVPSSAGAVLTPSDIVIRRQTTHGSAAVDAVRVDHVVLFVQRAKRKIREFAKALDVEGYRAFDMTRLADHITRSGIVEMTYAEEPYSVVWVVRTDGQLPAMTFRREEDVVGWARHILGGTFAGGDAMAESVAAIPGANGTGQVKNSEERDEVWVIAKRTIDGATNRYIEIFERDWETGDRQEDAFYVDSCVTLDIPITISGATAADPVMITATGHNLSDGNEVKITEIKGMTELNGNSYFIANTATNTFELLSTIGVNLTGATQANPVVITSVAHGFADGDIIGLLDVSGMTELNGNIYTVANKTDDTFELSGTDGTGFTAYTAGGTIHHVIDGTSFTTYISDGEVRLKGTSISGYDHLEGETVRILADGAIQADKTVSSGAFTLDTAAAVVHAGLAYTHKMETLKIEGGTAVGTAVGKTKQIGGVTFVLLNSHTLTFGPDEDNLTTIDFREVADLMDRAVPYFTGEVFRELEGDWETDPLILIQSSDPSPFTLLALAAEVDVRELV